MNDSFSPPPPEDAPDYGVLYVTSDERSLLSKLRDSLHTPSVVTEEPYPDVVRVHCSSDAMPILNEAISTAFTPAQMERMRCRLFSSQVVAPSLSELMRTQTLRAFKASLDGRWLTTLLRSKRLITHFQPIVRNVEPTEVFAYECLIRGLAENGDLISPGRLFQAARDTGMLQALDEEARLVSIHSARENALETCVFVNFNPRFMDNHGYLKETMRAVRNSQVPAERFVFEVIESDEIVDSDKLSKVLNYCRDCGCRVALDDLGAGYSSLNLMAKVKPDFVKLDMDLIRDVHKDLYKSCVANKLLELARELDVQTVVEGVERYEEWKWATEHGAEYSQGFLFARPDAVPPVPRPITPAASLPADAGEHRPTDVRQKA